MRWIYFNFLIFKFASREESQADLIIKSETGVNVNIGVFVIDLSGLYNFLLNFNSFDVTYLLNYLQKLFLRISKHYFD